MRGQQGDSKPQGSPQLICYLYCCCKCGLMFFVQAIYVARNAKDNLVSYYYFDLMNKTQPEPGPFEDYIGKFMRGECE